MKFDTPAGKNPIDQGKVVGRALPRIDGALKTTGTATYSYEQHAAVANPAYGYIVGAPIAKGRIQALDVKAARAAPGVLAVVALPRPLMFNNTSHRPATVQRVRIGAGTDGKIAAIGHDSWSGNLPGGMAERATLPTASLYAGAHRLLRTRLVTLDLPEGNAMRAPGEAPGMMAFEVAMDKLAEKLALDPVELRVRNDTQHDPAKPERQFSTRPFIACLRTGAERFGWQRRQRAPGSVRDGDWLLGMGNPRACVEPVFLPADREGIPTT